MGEINVGLTKGCLMAKDIQKITGFKRAKAQRIFRTLREAKRRQLDRDFPDRVLKDEVYLFPEDVAPEIGLPVDSVLRRIAC